MKFTIALTRVDDPDVPETGYLEEDGEAKAEAIRRVRLRIECEREAMTEQQNLLVGKRTRVLALQQSQRG
ncbi:MAG: hypothetical protein GEU90_20855 [Gemmatimonas sp.]|nr:hypothetical protein [Gemmatimonas sp.]